jgi:hypothetical protein
MLRHNFFLDRNALMLVPSLFPLTLFNFLNFDRHIWPHLSTIDHSPSLAQQVLFEPRLNEAPPKSCFSCTNLFPNNTKSRLAMEWPPRIDSRQIPNCLGGASHCLGGAACLRHDDTPHPPELILNHASGSGGTNWHEEMTQRFALQFMDAWDMVFGIAFASSFFWRVLGVGIVLLLQTGR